MPDVDQAVVIAPSPPSPPTIPMLFLEAQAQAQTASDSSTDGLSALAVVLWIVVGLCACVAIGLAWRFLCSKHELKDPRKAQSRYPAIETSGHDEEAFTTMAPHRPPVTPHVPDEQKGSVSDTSTNVSPSESVSLTTEVSTRKTPSTCGTSSMASSSSEVASPEMVVGVVLSADFGGDHLAASPPAAAAEEVLVVAAGAAASDTRKQRSKRAQRQQQEQRRIAAERSPKEMRLLTSASVPHLEVRENRRAAGQSPTRSPSLPRSLSGPELKRQSETPDSPSTPKRVAFKEQSRPRLTSSSPDLDDVRSVQQFRPSTLPSTAVPVMQLVAPPPDLPPPPRPKVSGSPVHTIRTGPDASDSDTWI